MHADVSLSCPNKTKAYRPRGWHLQPPVRQLARSYEAVRGNHEPKPWRRQGAANEETLTSKLTLISPTAPPLAGVFCCALEARSLLPHHPQSAADTTPGTRDNPHTAEASLTILQEARRKSTGESKELKAKQSGICGTCGLRARRIVTLGPDVSGQADSEVQGQIPAHTHRSVGES